MTPSLRNKDIRRIKNQFAIQLNSWCNDVPDIDDPIAPQQGYPEDKNRFTFQFDSRRAAVPDW